MDSSPLRLTSVHSRTVRKNRARILKHLLEAEKSTFREELSFHRSESTTGLGNALVFVY